MEGICFTFHHCELRTYIRTVMSGHGQATHNHCHTTSYNLAAALPRACVHTINNNKRVQSGSRSTTPVWIITVGHWTFAEQNQLMTEQKHRCSDIVADRSIDAVANSWFVASILVLFTYVHVAPYHKCTVPPTMSDQCDDRPTSCLL